MGRVIETIPIVLCIIALAIEVARADESAAARAYYERGLAFEKEKRYAEALADYSQAIELAPRFVDAYFARSSLYAGHPDLEKRDYVRAVADLSKILEIEPKHFSARFNRALHHESLREYDEAIADYSKAIQTETGLFGFAIGDEQRLARVFHYRGRAYQWYKRDFVKAAADYTEAIRLDPKIEMVHYRRGQTHHALKEYAKAQDDYAMALQRDPNYPNLLNSWAWQLATCPDPKYRDGRKALGMARKALVRSGGKSSEIFETEAAACAETGRFEEAIQSQKQAIRLWDAEAVWQRRAAAARLKLYEAGKRFREE